VKVTEQMIYAFAGEPEITATDAHAIEAGLQRVLDLIDPPAASTHDEEVAVMAAAKAWYGDDCESSRAVLNAALKDLWIAETYGKDFPR